VDPRRRTIALLALTLGVFLVTLNVTVVVVALPDIAADLQAAPDTTAWIIDAYNLVGASLLLTAGFLADRFGRRRMLLTGYALFSGGALLCALAPSISFLLAFRVVQAIGGTALTPTSLAIVANIYPDPRERAKAIGIWGVSSGLGLGLGPIIGGAAVDALGWRSVFAVNAVIGLAALVAVLRVVPASRSAVARRIDVPGQLLAVAFLASLTYALIEAGRYGWTSPRILAILAADVVLAIAFLRTERRTADPLLELGFFRDRQFSGTVAITVAAFFAFGGFVYENTLFLEQGRGYSALAAGLLSLPSALPTLVGGPVSGRLVATRGPRGVLGAATATMALGLVLLAALPGDAPIEALLACYALVGIGYAVLNAPISTVAVASMPREQAGVAAAVVSSGRNVGIVLGVAALGALAASRLPDAASAVEMADAIAPAYVLAAAVLAAATVVARLTLRAVPPVAVSSAPHRSP
jgi:EmrB/QacA subfamily drug resistance transporter